MRNLELDQVRKRHRFTVTSMTEEGRHILDASPVLPASSMLPPYAQEVPDGLDEKVEGWGSFTREDDVQVCTCRHAHAMPCHCA